MDVLYIMNNSFLILVYPQVDESYDQYKERFNNKIGVYFIFTLFYRFILKSMV